MTHVFSRILTYRLGSHDLLTTVSHINSFSQLDIIVKLLMIIILMLLLFIRIVVVIVKVIFKILNDECKFVII